MDNPYAVDLKRRGYRLLAAAVTWAVVCLAYLAPITPGQWLWPKWAGLGAALVFGVAIFVVTRDDSESTSTTLTTRYWAFLVAALAVLAMVLLDPRDIVFILTIIYAAVLPEYFSLRRSVAIQLTLHGVLTVAYILRWHGGAEFFLESLLWLGFEAFALLSSQIAADERRARQELQFSHQQLEATQAMLAATSRQDERLRISRDIHDVMGHHLTSLSLQLEVASHSEDQRAKDHLAQAQLLTRLLLADVRQVVSDLRDIPATNLGEALHSLIGNTGHLTVDLQLPEPLIIEDTTLAEAVFRIVQEIITNAVRHSGATRLQIELTADEPVVHILACDNGSLRQLPTEGNGLRGMRERIEALGGTLELRIVRGLVVDIHLPGRRH